MQLSEPQSQIWIFCWKKKVKASYDSLDTKAKDSSFSSIYWNLILKYISGMELYIWDIEWYGNGLNDILTVDLKGLF